MMPVYSKCYLTPIRHLGVYIVSSLLATVLVYIFYHLIPISLFLGLLLGIYLERMYSQSVVRKRKRNLRLQFRTFLESMSVACRAGSTEVKAIESALADLRVSYRADSDIVREIENILIQYKNGGVALKTLFSDFAERSDLEDIHSFAAIYAVIEGKNDRIGDILVETSQIIGDKIEIEQEIETTITSAKSETTMMLILPIILVLAMTFMGGELMESLFTTMQGHIAATAALAIFAVSYVLAARAGNIDV